MSLPRSVLRQFQRHLNREGLVILPRYAAHLFQPFLQSLLTHKGWVYRSDDPLMPALYSLSDPGIPQPYGVVADTHTNRHDLFQLITKKVIPVVLIADRYPASFLRARSPFAGHTPWIYWQDRRVIRLVPVEDREALEQALEHVREDPRRVVVKSFPYQALSWPVSRDRSETLFRLFLLMQHVMEEEEALRFSALYRRDPGSFSAGFHLWMQRITRDPDRIQHIQEDLGVLVQVSRGRFRFLFPHIRKLRAWLSYLPPDREVVLFPHPRTLSFFLQRWAFHRPFDTVLLPHDPESGEAPSTLSETFHGLRSRWTRSLRLQEDGVWGTTPEAPTLTTQPSADRSVMLLLRHPGPDDPLLVASIPPVSPPPPEPTCPAYILEGYLEGERFQMLIDHPVGPAELPDRAQWNRDTRTTFSSPPPLTLQELLQHVRRPSDIPRLHRLLGVLFKKRLLFHPYLQEGTLLDPLRLRRLAQRMLQRRYPDLSPEERTPPPYALLPASPLFAEDVYHLLGPHPDAHDLLHLYRTLVRRFLSWMLPDAEVDLERLTVRVGPHIHVQTRITRIHTEGHLWVLPVPLRDPLRPPVPVHGLQVRGVRREDFGILLARCFSDHPAPLPFWYNPAHALFRRLG